MNLRIPSTLLVLATLYAPALAQQDAAFTCNTGKAAVREALHHNDPDMLAAIAATQAELEAFTAIYPEGARSNYVVPVVFHIIHDNGEENISDEQVYDAMRILNEDFNKQNPDWQNVRPEFLDLVANVSIEFRLARKDPNGACTKGITRTMSTLTYSGDQDMKDLIQWPRNKYLNVWVGASAAGAAGYTFIPSDANFFPDGDGIVLMHSYVGSIGTGSVSRSRAFTHEVGHWINLEHTWGGGDPGDAGNCSDSDGVSDTPPTTGWTTCNLNGNTCTAPLDNVENYMEYSYCSKMFTTGQSTRMIAALNSSVAQRNQLTTNSNLTATGVNLPEVLCAADFTSDQRVICAGGSITFSDDSYHTVTSRNWSFTGGTPSTSTTEDPVITYNTPGTYAVSLTASDGSTTLTNNQTAYITVLPSPGGAIPAVEGFESVANLNGPEWTTINPNNDNTFGVTSVASYSGSKSVRIVNTAAMDGRLDELRSSTYDMSDATQIVITYRYAYAKRTNANDDVLRLYVSGDCGGTWSLRKIQRASNTLTTGGITTSSFIPSNPGQWGYAEVTNITSTSAVPDFRIKFEFESNGGNNLYLDDININGAPVGLEEVITSNTGLLVLPNPADEGSQAFFTTRDGGPIALELLDMTGRLVRTLHQATLAVGDHRVQLPISELQAGIYFLRLHEGAHQRTTKFVVR